MTPEVMPPRPCPGYLTLVPATAPVGPLLRRWRQTRGLSQLALAE